MFEICKNTCRSNSQEKCQKLPKLLEDEGEDRFEVSWSNSYGSSREPYIDKFSPNCNNFDYEGADTMQFIRRKGQNTQRIDYESDNTTR